MTRWLRRLRVLTPAVLMLAAAQLAAQQPGGAASRQACNSAVPATSFVSVNGVRLAYLDWGGDGPPLVLIHGLGDSPHAFDDVAWKLCRDFRIIAYARRGHGQSDAPDGPYDNTTLVEDLRQLMDSLGIRRASLLGWSMGGNEITAFAVRYPERTQKLVYLEAAYDWSEPGFRTAVEHVPFHVAPDSAALRSLDHFRAWFRGLMPPDEPWTPGLEAYLRDITRVTPDGAVQPIPTAAVTGKLWASLTSAPRDYTAVRAPALALFSPRFLDTARDPEQAKALAAWERDYMGPFRRASIERIRRELRGVVVQELPNTSHPFVPFQNVTQLAEHIRRFLIIQQPGSDRAAAGATEHRRGSRARGE